MVTVFGGTGFLGRRLVHGLLPSGYSVRVAVRHPERAKDVWGSAEQGDFAILPADVREPVSVAAAVAGAHAVVNAVSAYVEKGDVTFQAVHERGAETVAREASAAGVVRFVHVSGIGANLESQSPYIRSRGRGERLVAAAFPHATIVRPSAMIGPGDALFSTLALLARLLPALPLIGGGHTRLQPVSVEDVAEAIARILANPEAAGRTYELAGPRVYTLRELVMLALRLARRRRLLVPIPFEVAHVLALLLKPLPSPPLTAGQVDLLRADNVASGALPGLRELRIEPKAIEEVVRTYVSRSSGLGR